MKLENLHPTGSFKDRAMTGLLTHLKHKGATDIVMASEGNAGVAASYVGAEIGLNVKVYLPSVTKALMLDRMKGYGAVVEVVGNTFDEADVAAKAFLKEETERRGMKAVVFSLVSNAHLFCKGCFCRQ